MADAVGVRKYFSKQVISGTNLQLFPWNGFLVESFFITLGPRSGATRFSAADRAMTTGATIDDVLKGAWPTSLLAASRPRLAALNIGHRRLAKVA
jgi:hypothetical protein